MRHFTDRGTVLVMEFLIRRKWWVTGAAALFGVVLVLWAAFDESPWLQGLLINVGTSFLLLAPLLYLNQALAEKVDVLDAELRGRVRGLAALKDALPSGPARTQLIDALLAEARQPGTAARVSPAEFDQLKRGGEFERTVALATMLGTSERFSADLVVRGVLWSDSANEQYYALLAADELWPRLDPAHQDDILGCLAGQSRAGRRIRHSSSRRAIAERITARAEEQAAVS